jgi:hypothetical protein
MSPCLYKKGMREIHDLLGPNCTTESEGVYLRMNCSVYMDAHILEFSGGKGKKKSIKYAPKKYGSYVPQ